MSCSLWEENRSAADDADDDCMKDLNSDVKSGNWGSLFSVLELEETAVEDEEGTAGAVMLAVSGLIWRFTWRGK